MTIRLKGGPELLRLLDELPKNLERNVIRGGLRAGAKVIQQQAKANVPVKTGQLKRAIGIGTRTDGAKLSSYVKLRGSGSYLGLFIEYGVAPHLISVSDADKPVRETRRGPRAVSTSNPSPSRRTSPRAQPSHRVTPACSMSRTSMSTTCKAAIMRRAPSPTPLAHRVSSTSAT